MPTCSVYSEGDSGGLSAAAVKRAISLRKRFSTESHTVWSAIQPMQKPSAENAPKTTRACTKISSAKVPTTSPRKIAKHIATAPSTPEYARSHLLASSLRHPLTPTTKFVEEVDNFPHSSKPTAFPTLTACPTPHSSAGGYGKFNFIFSLGKSSLASHCRPSSNAAVADSLSYNPGPPSPPRHNSPTKTSARYVFLFA